MLLKYLPRAILDHPSFFFSELCILSATILILGCVLFAALAKSGENLLNRIEQRERLPHVGKALNGPESSHSFNNYQYGTH